MAISPHLQLPHCRSLETEARQWVLLARSKEAVGEEGGLEERGRRVTMTQLGIQVDGSRFS